MRAARDGGGAYCLSRSIVLEAIGWDQRCDKISMVQTHTHIIYLYIYIYINIYTIIYIYISYIYIYLYVHNGYDSFDCQSSTPHLFG